MIVLEFILGIFIAYLYIAFGRKHSVGLFTFLLGIGLLVASIGYEGSLNRFIKWGIPSALLIFGAVNIRQCNVKLLSYLGAASYSIYLIQVFTIPAFYKFAPSYMPGIDNDLMALSCLFFSIAAGAFTYSFIENPITNYTRRYFVRLSTSTKTFNRTL